MSKVAELVFGNWGRTSSPLSYLQMLGKVEADITHLKDEDYDTSTLEKIHDGIMFILQETKLIPNDELSDLVSYKIITHDKMMRIKGNITYIEEFNHIKQFKNYPETMTFYNCNKWQTIDSSSWDYWKSIELDEENKYLPKDIMEEFNKISHKSYYAGRPFYESGVFKYKGMEFSIIEEVSDGTSWGKKWEISYDILFETILISKEEILDKLTEWDRILENIKQDSNYC